MATIIAISGGVKTPVFSHNNHQVVATTRRELAQSEENMDMLGNQICKYRIRK